MPALATAGAVLIALNPVFFHSSLLASFTLPKLAALSAALAACWAGLLQWLSRGGSLQRPPLGLPLVAGWLALAVSALLSDDRWLSFYGQYNYYAYGLWVCSLSAGAYLAAAWVLQSEGPRRAALAASLLAASAAGLYGAVQAAGFEPFPAVGRLVGGRAPSTVGSPVSLGGYLAMMLPLAIHWTLREGPALGAVSTILIGAGLASSVSRGAWIAGALAAAAYFLWTGAFRGLRGPRLWGLLAAAAVAVGGAAWRVSQRPFAKAGELARTTIWKTALDVYKERPVLGIGPDAFELGFRRLKREDYVRAATSTEYQAHAHNDILQAMATAGTLGLLAYLVFWWRLVEEARAGLARGDPLAAALAAALLSLFISLKFNPMPVEVYAVAAILAAALSPAPAPVGAGASRDTAGAGLVLAGAASLASLGLSLRFISADQHEKLAHGSPRHFQEALARNPCELNYIMNYVNHLNAAASATQPPLRQELLDRSVEQGRAAVICHPKSTLSHFILGAALLTDSRTGRPDRLAEAERELDVAVSLDPRFVPVLEVRRHAAAFRGDAAKVDELTRRIEHLKALSR